MTLTTTAHSSQVPDEWNQMRDGVLFLYEGQLAVTESSWAITVTIPFKDLLFDAGTLVNHVKQIRNLTHREPIFKSDRGSNLTDITALTIYTIQDHVEQLCLRADDLLFRVDLLISTLRNPDILSTRGRRSILPFVGDISHFLFGTARDVDIKELRTQLRQLGLAEQKVAHIVQKSMTLINTTYFNELEDRRAINHLINTTSSLSIQVVHLQQSLAQSDWTRSLRTLMIVQVQSAIHTALLAFTELESLITRWTNTASELAQGVLPSGLITPPQLAKILRDVETQLPNIFSLAIGPNSDILTYYKYLQAIPIPDKNVPHVLVLVPLRKLYDDFDVYRIIPTPKHFNNSVISYENLRQRLVVSIDHSRYFIPEQTDVTTCINQHLTTCPVRDPYMSTEELSCEMALFLNKSSIVTQQCRRLITVGAVSPSAVYITNGHWIVFPGTKPTSLTIVCPNPSQTSSSPRYVKNPYVEHITKPRVIVLNSGCEGVGKYVSLPMYYNRDSSITLNASRISGFLGEEMEKLKYWKSLDEKLVYKAEAVTVKPLIIEDHLLNENIAIPMESVEHALKFDHPIFKGPEDLFDYLRTEDSADYSVYWVYSICGVALCVSICVLLWRCRHAVCSTMRGTLSCCARKAVISRTPVCGDDEGMPPLMEERGVNNEGDPQHVHVESGGDIELGPVPTRQVEEVRVPRVFAFTAKTTG